MALRVRNEVVSQHDVVGCGSATAIKEPAEEEVDGGGDNDDGGDYNGSYCNGCP